MKVVASVGLVIVGTAGLSLCIAGIDAIAHCSLLLGGFAAVVGMATAVISAGAIVGMTER